MTSTLNLLRNSATAVAAISLLSLTSCTSLQQQLAGVGKTADQAADAPASKEESDRREGSDNSSGDQPTAPATPTKNPTGYKTQNPFHVISPYKPNNLIDISKNPRTGQPFQSGDLVKDPSNGAIFRIP